MPPDLISHSPFMATFRQELSITTGKISPEKPPTTTCLLLSDHFDHLPDSLLLLIFNKLADVKALGRCCIVSKRFHSLARQVDNVIVNVDCVIDDDDDPVSGTFSGNSKNLLLHLFRSLITSLIKPIHHLFSPVSTKPNSPVSHHSPTEVLKNFNGIKTLRIQLPGGELGTEQGVVLKWRADFGTSLDSCLILGASSCEKTRFKTNPNQDFSDFCSESSDGGAIPESFYTNGSLKLRVVWTISSLIAASARHFLLNQIIADHPTLESLVLTDSDDQGVLCMNREQLQQLRAKPLSVSSSSNRTQVPALNLKLWYAPHMELPGGFVLKGATLVAIRPSDQNRESSSTTTMENWVSMAFEEPFRSAAALLVKRRNFCLEMNSF